MLHQTACHRFGQGYDLMRQKRMERNKKRGEEKLLVKCKKSQNDNLFCKDNLSFQKKRSYCIVFTDFSGRSAVLMCITCPHVTSMQESFKRFFITFILCVGVVVRRQFMVVSSLLLWGFEDYIQICEFHIKGLYLLSHIAEPCTRI